MDDNDVLSEKYPLLGHGHRHGRGHTPKPLSLEQLRAHPEYPHASWARLPHHSGKAEVAHDRGGPFSISYHLHGAADDDRPRLVFITGLGAQQTSWQRQTKDFTASGERACQCLTLDNRGVGESDKPFLRYTTTEMARDVLEVLDHIGWTASRSLHVVAISMGGMIAQELALMIPDRISSLNLVSTTSLMRPTLAMSIVALLPLPLAVKLEWIKSKLFTPEYLASPDDTEYIVQPFPTNGDRFTSVELQKRLDPSCWSRWGFLSQAWAAVGHHKTAEQLAMLGDAVGRERICIMHGTGDKVVGLANGQRLLESLGGVAGGVSAKFFNGAGHVLLIECRREFNEVIATMVQKGRLLTKEAMIDLD